VRRGRVFVTHFGEVRRVREFDAIETRRGAPVQGKLAPLSMLLLDYLHALLDVEF
jgi:hypothetical protein